MGLHPEENRAQLVWLQILSHVECQWLSPPGEAGEEVQSQSRMKRGIPLVWPTCTKPGGTGEPSKCFLTGLLVGSQSGLQCGWWHWWSMLGLAPHYTLTNEGLKSSSQLSEDTLTFNVHSESLIISSVQCEEHNMATWHFSKARLVLSFSLLWTPHLRKIHFRFK